MQTSLTYPLPFRPKTRRRNDPCPTSIGIRVRGLAPHPPACASSSSSPLDLTRRPAPTLAGAARAATARPAAHEWASGRGWWRSASTPLNQRPRGRRPGRPGGLGYLHHPPSRQKGHDHPILASVGIVGIAGRPGAPRAWCATRSTAVHPHGQPVLPGRCRDRGWHLGPGGGCGACVAPSSATSTASSTTCPTAAIAVASNLTQDMVAGEPERERGLREDIDRVFAHHRPRGPATWRPKSAVRTAESLARHTPCGGVDV